MAKLTGPIPPNALECGGGTWAHVMATNQHQPEPRATKNAPPGFFRLRDAAPLVGRSYPTLSNTLNKETGCIDFGGGLSLRTVLFGGLRLVHQTSIDSLLSELLRRAGVDQGAPAAHQAPTTSVATPTPVRRGRKRQSTQVGLKGGV